MVTFTLVWGGRSQRRVEGQIRYFVPRGKAGLDIPAALTIGLGTRSTASRAARQAVKLRVEPAGREFLSGVNILTTLPPLAVLGGLGYGLGAGLGLGDI